MGKKIGPNPTDRGKGGVKRSLLTEGNGIPIGLTVDGANRHDMKLAEPTLDAIVVERPEPTEEEPQGMCLDKGYDYDAVRETLSEFGFTAHIWSHGGVNPGLAAHRHGSQAGLDSDYRRSPAFRRIDDRPAFQHDLRFAKVKQPSAAIRFRAESPGTQAIIGDDHLRCSDIPLASHPSVPLPFSRPVVRLLFLGLFLCFL